MNHVSLIGQINEVSLDKKDLLFKMEVKRHYKNENEDFVIDCFVCKLWKGAMEVMTASCKVGDIIAIEGRLENDNDKTLIIVEKIKFLYKENKYVR